MCHGVKKEKFVPKKGKSTHENAKPFSRKEKHIKKYGHEEN